MKDSQHVSNRGKFIDNSDWSGLEFPVSIKDSSMFEIKNNISINVLAVEGRDIYIHRKISYQRDREIKTSFNSCSSGSGQNSVIPLHYQTAHKLITLYDQSDLNM